MNIYKQIFVNEGGVMKKRKVPRRGRRRRKTIGDHISTLILIIAIVVLAVCGYKLYQIQSGYWEGDKDYKELKELAIQENDETGEDADASTEPRYTIDFGALEGVNSDIKAWLRFDEPAIIDYPVVQGRDNEVYLHRTLSGYDNTMGAIFINAGNKADFTDRHTIVYGHNMNNGSMFGELDSYNARSFWEQYPYFYIYTPDGAEIRYKIVAAGVVLSNSDLYQYAFASDEDFEQFLGLLNRTALYDTGASLNKDSQIVTLSTCTAATGENRFIVSGVKDEVRVPRGQ